MERENFDTWLLGKPDWNEISFRYNTGREYQHKQDLKAVFGTTFKYIEQKFKAYYQEFKQVPNETLDNLIYTFRQHFPLHGRIEGVPYFDELIIGMIERYSIGRKYNTPTETTGGKCFDEVVFKTLFEAFEDPEKYQRIMNFLVLKEYCNSGNFTWNCKKGKKTAMGLLDMLKVQGYLKRELKCKEKRLICKETFDIDIAERYCSTKAKDVNLPDIPLASTY